MSNNLHSHILSVLKEREFAAKLIDFDSGEFEQQLYSVFHDVSIIYGGGAYSKADHPEIDEKMSLIEFYIVAMYEIFRGLSPQDQGSVDDFLAHLKSFFAVLMPHFCDEESLQKEGVTNRKEIGLRCLQARVTISDKWYSDFWNKVFFGNFLYLDIIAFAYYCSGIFTLDMLKERRHILITLSLKVIRSAASSDHHIYPSEKKIYSSFVQAAMLNADFSKKLLKDAELPYDIEQLEDLRELKWLTRKYVLDLAVLVLWSDKTLQREESAFLKILSDKLHFSKVELNQSLLSVAGFLLSNQAMIDNFNKKEVSGEIPGFDLLKNVYVERMRKVLMINQKRLKKEISESKELVQLLAKSRKTDLTTEEREKVRKQLVDVLKSVPLFVALAMPMSFITLPILLSILPKQVLPSAFAEDEEDLDIK